MQPPCSSFSAPHNALPLCVATLEPPPAKKIKSRGKTNFQAGEGGETAITLQKEELREARFWKCALSRLRGRSVPVLGGCRGVTHGGSYLPVVIILEGGERGANTPPLLQEESKPSAREAVDSSCATSRRSPREPALVSLCHPLATTERQRGVGGKAISGTFEGGGHV
jgi:hypothetical protein